MKKLIALMFAAMFALSFVACGDDEEEAVDNQAACEDWLAAMDCGEYDFGQGVDCALYEDVACDVSDYFNCLTDNTECVNDVPDIAGWADCANLASCE